MYALTFYEKVYYLLVAAVIGAVVRFLFLQVQRFVNDLRIDRMLSKIPTPPGAVPMLGHALQLGRGRPWDQICSDFPNQLNSPNIVRFQMFRDRVLLVNTPQLIGRVLQSHQRKYNKHLDSYKEFMCLLGNGLVTSEGAKWRHGRTLLSAAMRIEILEALPEIAINCVDLMLTRIKKESGGSSAAGGNVVDLQKHFHRLTLQVIGRAVLSLDPDECEHVFAKLYLPIVDECNARVWEPWRNYMFWSEGYKGHAECLDKLNEYFCNLIRTRWEERQSGKRDPSKGCKEDILDLYMKQCDRMDTKTTLQLRDDLKTMVLAGHETTAAMLTWTTYELIKNPELAERVRQEHQRVFGSITFKRGGGGGGGGEMPTLQHLEKLKVTRGCLREALRKYSVVPLVMRVANEDDFVRKEESGLDADLTIPTGTAIAVGITSVHNNPTLWPNPQQYEPQRMIDLDESMDSVQYSFVPFIAGPRNCMGQHLSLTEAQFIISFLISRTSMELAPEASGTPHKYIVPKVPENGLPVKVNKVETVF